MGNKYAIRVCQYCQQDFSGPDPEKATTQRDNHETVCPFNPNRVYNK